MFYLAFNKGLNPLIIDYDKYQYAVSEDISKSASLIKTFIVNELKDIEKATTFKNESEAGIALIKLRDLYPDKFKACEIGEELLEPESISKMDLAELSVYELVLSIRKVD